MKREKKRTENDAAPPMPESGLDLLGELVAHLRKNRTQLREEWAKRIREAQLLTAMSEEEIFSEATSVYDKYMEALETGSVEALQEYARDLSERIIPRGVETREVLGIVLLLRDVLARSLFKKYQSDFALLNRVLDAYEPAANRIANTVAVGFVQERERIIRQQQEAIRELSTPVLQVRERLLILPIIGVIDPQRARQLTEQLLRAIRANRAKVVVIDVTGVAAMDSGVANHLVQTVEASRLLGATVIVTGLSPEIAQTLVTIADDAGPRNRARIPALTGGRRGGTDSAAGAISHCLDSVRPYRRRSFPSSRSPDRPGRAVALPRRHRGRHRTRRHGLLRRADAARHRAHGPPPRRRDGHRGDPARRGIRHGAARPDAQGRRDRARSRRRPRVPESPNRRALPRDQTQATERAWVKSCDCRSPRTLTSLKRDSKAAR